MTRRGMAGHAEDGTPTVSTESVWVKLGHYQQQQGTDGQTPTGMTEYQVYRFWLPFMTGESRPQPTDILTADGYSFKVIGVEQETFKHHLIVRAQRVER